MVQNAIIVAITGSRYWCRDAHVYSISCILNSLPRSTPIVLGDAKGVDSIALEVARDLGFTDIRVHYADWAKFGKRAGPIRNRAMLDENPTVVVAFHDDLANSRGTKDMVQAAKRRGIRVEVITGGEAYGYAPPALT